MPERRVPVVLGLLLGFLVLAGCSASSAEGPTIGIATDAAAGQDGQDRGEVRPEEAPPVPSGGEAADAAIPLVDGPPDVPPESASRPDPGAKDAAQPSDTVTPGDARGGQATSDPLDAPSAADVMSPGGGKDAATADPETGRLAGITAAHNAVRAAVQTQPALPPLIWSQTIADYAQQWATSLATTMCAQPQHRSGVDLLAKGYGENLATFGAGGTLKGGTASTAEQAVSAWAAEKACWTFGTISGTETCDKTCYTNLHSDGCGHYTQVVWRGSTMLGCGVATCKNGALTEDIWICNYAPAGNFIGRLPY
jgi:pathogenesis-related protein 1